MAYWKNFLIGATLVPLCVVVTCAVALCIFLIAIHLVLNYPWWCLLVGLLCLVGYIWAESEDRNDPFGIER